MSAARGTAVVGVSDHAGWAVLVTAARDGTLLDRRRVALLDEHLPKLPYHHEAQGLPLAEAEELIGRVRASAERLAQEALDALARELPSRLAGIAIRACPPLPDTVAGCLQDYRAQNVADTVMYRRALAGAAEARGLAVRWYDARSVLDAARAALGGDDLQARFERLRTSLGPPWSKDHRVALAAAIAAADESPR